MIENLSNNFSENLKVIVNQYFRTQKKLAENLNVSEQTVSHYIKGVSFPPIEAMIKLELMTGIPILVMVTERLKGRKLPLALTEGSNLIDNQILREPEVAYKRRGDGTDLPELREKVDMLWMKNLHRAEKAESIEVEIKLLKSEVQELKKRVRELERETPK